MRKLLGVLFTLAVVLCSTTVGFAEATKAAAASSVAGVVHINTGGPVTTPFVNAVGLTMRNPGPQGVFVTFNAQTLLAITSEQVVSPVFPFSITEEAVGIQARLLVDGVPVPYAGTLTVVNLDNQFQFLQRVQVPGIDALILATGQGGIRSVTWIVPSTDTGVHTFQVQTRFTSSTFNVPIPATFDSVMAIVGAKNLTVESVNLR